MSRILIECKSDYESHVLMRFIETFLVQGSELKGESNPWVRASRYLHRSSISWHAILLLSCLCQIDDVGSLQSTWMAVSNTPGE